jgi:S-formylglutathione hydrolase FrmB
MKLSAFLVTFLAGACCAQQPETFQPAETNVWGAEYPRVDAAGRVQIRIKGESPGTDHEWQTWRRNLKDFAPRLFRAR